MTAQIACYGRLAADPRPHETSSGKPMASARLAVEIEARTDGESGAETWWLSVLAFGRTAESLMRHAKGEPMSMSGRLQSQRWTDRATGERREGWQCIADAIVSARSVRPGGCRRSREGDASTRREARSDGPGGVPGARRGDDARDRPEYHQRSVWPASGPGGPTAPDLPPRSDSDAPFDDPLRF